MKIFLKKFFIFSIPAILYCIVSVFYMPHLLSLAHGPSTKQQIDRSFENADSREYELLILGNSRTYRGINPDYLSYKAYNFSHDNDAYNQIYFKLKRLIEKKKELKYVILGVDYFQFSMKNDSRNYVYADLLDREYMNDFEESRIFVKKLEYHLGNIEPKKILTLFEEKSKPFLKENGQYITPGIAKESDKIERDLSRLDFQVKYFERTLALCDQHGIKVYAVTLPIRQNELDGYPSSGITDFKYFIEKYIDNEKVYYLDFSKLEGFNIGDYTDITHLNEAAADRFSQILDKKILEINSELK